MSDLLRMQIQKEDLTPVALASKRTTLAHKMHALLHAMYLRTPSWATVARCMHCISCWTSDQGTERLLCQFPSMPLGELFRWEDGPAAEEDEDMLPFPQEAAARPKVNEHVPALELGTSLYMPGLLHIISNATKNLRQSMRDMDYFLKGLALVAQLLGKQHYRERYVNTCLNCLPGPEKQLYMDKLQEVKMAGVHVYENRWGTVVDAVFKVRDIAWILRETWSPEKFGFGVKQPQHAEGHDPSVFSTESVDFYIQASYWWAYLRMVALLANTLDHAEHWAESCPCHASHPPGFQCPLRSRRAPELAVSALLRLMERDLDCATQELRIMATEADLTGEEQMSLHRDFLQGKKHLLFVFGLKLAAFQTLPWTLAGVAHYSESVAREHAEKVLRIFDNAAVPADLHPLCAGLQQGQPLRASLEGFVAGEPRDEVVQRFAARFAFVRVSERHIEGRHAKLKSFIRTCPHHSPALVAWRAVSQALADEVVTAQAVSALAAQCARTRTALGAAGALGFSNHPLIAALLKTKTKTAINHDHYKVVRDCIYHCDAETRFQNHHVALPGDVQPRPSLAAQFHRGDPNIPEADLLHHYALIHLHDHILTQDVVLIVQSALRATLSEMTTDQPSRDGDAPVDIH